MWLLRNLLILCVLAVPCLADEPLEIVKRFYGELKALEVRGDIEEPTIGKFRPLMTDDLNREFTESQKAMALWWNKENQERAATEKIKAADPDVVTSINKPPFVDSAIFSGIYEAGKVASYGDPSVAGERAYIPVKVIDEPSQGRWTDLVILHHTKDGWRIDDILYNVQEGRAQSLREGIDSKALEH